MSVALTFFAIICIFITALLFSGIIRGTLNHISKAHLIESKSKEMPTFGLTATPPWTSDERRMWAAFLASPVGLSLWQRARHVQSGLAIQACADSISTTHSAAQASGFSECLKWFESLAKPEPISGASAVQDATTATSVQNDAAPADFRRSF